MTQWNRTWHGLVVLGLLAAPVGAQERRETEDTGAQAHTRVTPAMLRDAEQSSNWLMYGGDYWNRRYSRLDRISRNNVRTLVPRMVFQTGIEQLGSFENTPIVVDGMMYVTTPYNIAIAYDLRSGKELWRYEHRLGTTIYCCGPNNRGVAIAHGLVYMATLDAQLVALDQRTGRVRWVTQIADPSFGYSETMAPLVIDDMVIIGISGAEYGIRGFVKAYNANTGQPTWTWYTIPSPEEGGWWGKWAETTPEGESLNRDIAKEKQDSARYANAWERGGGSVWMTPAFDPESGLLFVAIGNPSPDLDGSVRPGDNLWTESIVALEARTGRFRWGYQYLPHDVWDLDAASPPVVTMLDGRKVVVHAGKTGWVYVLDAETGRLVRRSDNVVPHENLFAQPTAEGTRMLPGANGGQEWTPIAVDPTLNFAFTAMLHQPMNYTVHSAPWEKGRLWLGSAFVAIPGEEQWGNVAAVNLADGKVAWEVKTEQPMIGGVTATAGGLLFTGEGNGWFKAYDSRTGDVLWQFYCGAGVNAAPTVYELDGEQFVAVAAGGNFQLGYPLGSAIFVFGLPMAAELQRRERSAAPALEPAELLRSRPARRAASHAASAPAASAQEIDPGWLRADPERRMAEFDLIATLTGHRGGLNFNGFADGELTWEVPTGWDVVMLFSNRDGVLPHSAQVIEEVTPVPEGPVQSAFPRAQTRRPRQGLQAGETDELRFTADRAGSYLILCAVPGHGRGGMWIRLEVSDEAEQPSMYRTAEGRP